MPSSLDEALKCIEDDHGFLLKGDVFTQELIETFGALTHRCGGARRVVQIRERRQSAVCICFAPSRSTSAHRRAIR
jgi:hypothetical protein